MIDEMRIISENVRAARKKAGFTQEEMARLIQISVSAYRKLEQNQRNFTLEHIINISNCLNINLVDLLRQSDDCESILNKTDTERKIFLIKLLQTFGIGAVPQKPYNLREISALLSFILNFGHTVSFLPNRYRLNYASTGHAKRSFFQQLGDYYPFISTGIEQQKEEIDVILKEKNRVIDELAEKKAELDSLGFQYCVENNEKLANIMSEIDKAEGILNDTKQQIEEANAKLYDIDYEIKHHTSELDRINDELAELNASIKAKTLVKKQLERVIESKETTLKKKQDLIDQGLISSVNSSLYLNITKDKWNQVVLKYNSLLEERNILIEQRNTAIKEYEDEESFWQSKTAEMKETLEDDILDSYHGLTPDDVDDMGSKLAYYAIAFYSLTKKYATSEKDLYKYIDEELANDGLNYERITNINYLKGLAEDYGLLYN